MAGHALTDIRTDWTREEILELLDLPLIELRFQTDTPLAKIDDIEFVRNVAVARITMPMSMVRLSADCGSMSEATQALCFMPRANLIFAGDKLLTSLNAGDDSDSALLAKLVMSALQQEEPMRAAKPGNATAPGLTRRGRQEPMQADK